MKSRGLKLLKKSLDALLAGNAARVIWFSLFAQIAGFAASVIVARMLGVSEYGRYAYCMTWVALLSQIAVLGMDRLMIREVAASIAGENAGVIRELLMFAVVVTCMATVVVVLLAFLLMRYGGFIGWFHVPHSAFWALAVFPLPVMLIVGSAVLRGAGGVVESQIPDRLVRPALFLASMVVAGYIGVPVDARLVVGAYSICTMIAMIWCWRMTASAVRDHCRVASIVRTDWTRWLRGYSSMGATAVLLGLLASSESVILGLIGDTTMVANYSIAYRISQAASVFTNVAGVLLGPSIVTLFVQGRRDELQALTTRHAQLALAISPVVLLPLVVWRQEVVLLVGSGFDHAASALAILCIGQLFGAVSGPAGSLLVYCGHESTAVFILMASLAINVGVSLVLIPNFGALGAAIASCASACAKSALLSMACSTKLNINALPFGRVWKLS